MNTNDFLSLSKKVLVTLIRFICSFFSAARRTNQEAPPRLSGFWLVATVAVGVCGTRFARTVLAHFSSVSLATSPPDKGGIGGLACILTPSPCGHSPYILLRKTQGEKVRCISLSPLLCPVALRGISFLYRRYLKLLLCVVPVIGEVSRREGGVKTTSHQSVYSILPLCRITV